MSKKQAYQLICTMPSGAARQINPPEHANPTKNHTHIYIYLCLSLVSRVLGCAIRRTRATQALKYDCLAVFLIVLQPVHDTNYELSI